MLSKADLTHKPGALWECNLSYRDRAIAGYRLLSKVLEGLNGSESEYQSSYWPTIAESTILSILNRCQEIV